MNARNAGYRKIIAVDDPATMQYQTGVFMTMFVVGDDKQALEKMIQYLIPVSELETIIVLTTMPSNFLSEFGGKVTITSPV